MTHALEDPATGMSGAIDADWDEAFLRVESYLRALGLESRIHLNRISSEVIAETRRRIGAVGAGEPVPQAIGIVRERIAFWLRRAGLETGGGAGALGGGAFGGGTMGGGAVGVRGRLALSAADVPGRWAGLFLSDDPLPPALREALAASQVLPTPELRLTSMAPAPLEFGFSGNEGPHVSGDKLGFPFRAAVSWLSIVGFLGIAWAASH